MDPIRKINGAGGLPETAEVRPPHWTGAAGATVSPGRKEELRAALDAEAAGRWNDRLARANETHSEYSDRGPIVAGAGYATPIPAADVDQHLADSLRIRVGQALIPVLKLMDEAGGHGMSIAWGVQRGSSGKFVIGPIDVVKHL